MRLIGLILAIGLSLAPLSIKAQPAAKIARIGYLSTGTQASGAQFTDAFRQGLRELGYLEGKTVVLEVRYGDAEGESFRCSRANWLDSSRT